MGNIVNMYKWKEEKNMESIFHVAAYLLSLESMNNKKLQKLCYYVQSWCYAFTGHLMFNEQFEAWVHGPVCPTLYRAYKQWGSLDIPRFTNVENINLREQNIAIIHAVYDAYGTFSAEELEACTHSERPWQNARKGYAPNEYCRVVISNEDMRAVCLEKIQAAEN